MEFLQNKEPGTAEIKQVRFQCSILEGQWASAQPHTTSTANYCIVTPIIPTSPTVYPFPYANYFDLIFM